MPEQQQPTLRDMIQSAARGGQTYEMLAKRAIDPVTGTTVSRSFLNQLARDTVERIPPPDKLGAIAAALGRPYEAVRRAAVRQWFPGDEEEPTTADLRRQIQDLQQTASRLMARLDEGEDDSASA